MKEEISRTKSIYVGIIYIALFIYVYLFML